MKKAVFVKNIQIGGGAPVTVQSMTNTHTTDISATVAQIVRLEKCGADIVRISTPDIESVNALKTIVKEVSVPIVADIHYDYKLAIAAIEAGAHKIRINPGNMPISGLKDLAAVASERKIPIRVGVNRGSLKNEKTVTPHRLAELAYDAAKAFEDAGHTDLVLAVKSSDVITTVKAYRELDKMCDYPLHIGLTEAGTTGYGAIKSSVAIGALLLDGIGDTLRVSLTGAPEEEIIVGRKILRAAGLDKNFVEVVACPTCARTQIEVEDLSVELEKRTETMRIPMKVAVMGCAVNGVGESKGADFGVCGGKGQSLIFKNGIVYKTVENDKIIDELITILGEYNAAR